FLFLKGTSHWLPITPWVLQIQKKKTLRGKISCVPIFPVNNTRQGGRMAEHKLDNDVLAFSI
ncbi:MAG TPA: hypothetical protein DCR17_05150, partial [Verrucomicrobiales bacterium]|nr:hypothetical protein [Verrucomicrobiales bacterium]